MVNIPQMERKRKMIHRDRIAQYLDENPNATVLEMSTNLRISNVGARLSELRKLGLIEQWKDSYTDKEGHTTYFNRYRLKGDAA